jgi:Uma2 family endonuclease
MMLSAPPDVNLEQIDGLAFVRLAWKDFLVFLKARGDTSANRIAYLDGVLQLMSPSVNHEGIKTNLARLIEHWSIQTEQDLRGFGSWTLTSPRSKSAVEPDECYVVGPRGRRQTPDIVIEVKWTSGGIEKLEIYRRLRIPEVWLWEKGQLVPYILKGGAYGRARRSALVPELDFALLSKFSLREDQDEAAREFVARARRAH